MKNLIKWILSFTPYRIYKNTTPNRFNAMEEALSMIAESQPSVDAVIDVGANEGQFHALAWSQFPTIPHHIIDPQPACAPALEKIAKAKKGVQFHPIGISSTNSTMQMIVPHHGGISTGARIVNSSTHATHSVEVQVATLDGFARENLTGVTHGLLKIDVEGHEWDVLSGAKLCIRQFRFVICETRFDLEKGNASEIVEWMNAIGFRWIDCAAISGHKNSGRAKLSDLVFERLESN